jgi:hypothetical protein
MTLLATLYARDHFQNEEECPLVSLVYDDVRYLPEHPLPGV